MTERRQDPQIAAMSDVEGARLERIEAALQRLISAVAKIEALVERLALAAGISPHG